eukprot:Colp12_sorted_trinity150504_noHs@9691
MDGLLGDMFSGLATLVLAGFCFLWRERFLFNFRGGSEIFGYLASCGLLAYLTMVAYWEEYMKNTGGRWWRIDWALGRIVTHILPHKHTCVPSVPYYIETHGYKCEVHKVKTADGHVLEVYRVGKPGVEVTHALPILLQHGLFQSSGIFVTSEEDSLAFILADEGYDVWLGNNRGVVTAHVTLEPNDIKYWDWCLDDLAAYDFPAMVNYVSKYSKSGKILYCGHSQGNAQAFAGLSNDPKLSDKIALMTALAPAYYIKFPKHWALQRLGALSEAEFCRFFGKKDMISIMHVVQKYFPARVFASLAYHMFNHLFEWSDTLWVKDRKGKY